jgi:hypothetical protein
MSAGAPRVSRYNVQLHGLATGGAMAQVMISQHPLVQHKLTLLRRATTEPKKFRELVRELSQFLL